MLSSIIIAVDPDAGSLVDGQSAGYFEVLQDPNAGAEGEPLFVRMTATWDASDQGLRVSAEDQDGPLGTSVVFPGSAEVLLSMDWNEKGRFLDGFPTDGFEEGFGTFSFFDVVPVPTGVSFVMAFGAKDLGKAARFYFTHLALRSASLISGGGEIAAAMNAAKQSLLSAMAEGSVHPSAQTKLATRSLKKGAKRLTRGGKLADKLVKKSKAPNNALAKRANQARWEALLIQAQLFGFKSKSIDKYFATLIVEPISFGF